AIYSPKSITLACKQGVGRYLGEMGCCGITKLLAVGRVSASMDWIIATHESRRVLHIAPRHSVFRRHPGLGACDRVDDADPRPPEHRHDQWAVGGHVP